VILASGGESSFGDGLQVPLPPPVFLQSLHSIPFRSGLRLLAVCKVLILLGCRWLDSSKVFISGGLDGTWRKESPGVGRGFLLTINAMSILSGRGKLRRQILNGNNSIFFRCLCGFCELRGLDMRFWLEIDGRKL
jgi:hypothetical protein